MKNITIQIKDAKIYKTMFGGWRKSICLFALALVALGVNARTTKNRTDKNGCDFNTASTLDHDLPTAPAVTTNWTGNANNSDFNTAGNWDNGLPSANNSAVITLNNNMNPFLSLSASITVGNLSLAGGYFSVGTFQLTGSGGTLSISSGSIASSLIVQGPNNFPTGFGTYSFTAGSTVLFNSSNSQNIPGHNYANLEVAPGTSSSVVKTLTGPIAMTGSLNIYSSATLDAGIYQITGTSNGKLTITGGLMLGASNFPVSFGSQIIDPSSNVTYNGAVAQTIATGFTYGTLTFLNTNGGLNYSTGTPTVSGIMNFGSGILNNLGAGSAFPLTLLPSVVLWGGNNTCYITGYINYMGTAIAGWGNAIKIPVGSATYYEPVRLTLTANGSGMLVHYVTANGGTGGLIAPLQSYCNSGYWDLTPLTTATGTVVLSYDQYHNLGVNTTSDIQSLVVSHYTSNKWQSEGSSTNDPGNVYNPSFVINSKTAGNVTSLNTISTWSPFTIGSTSAVLPITLTSFTGIASGCTANLAWTTATETNSSYYAVEASTDAATYNQVAKVNSKNSATGAGYTYTSALVSGTTYFRLKAVDNDGKFIYSSVVTVTGTGACGMSSSVMVSPNPTKNVINIQGLTIGNTISIYGINGQKMTSVIATGTNQSINISSFAKGVYMMRTKAADGTLSNVKVVKN